VTGVAVPILIGAAWYCGSSSGTKATCKPATSARTSPSSKRPARHGCPMTATWRRTVERRAPVNGSGRTLPGSAAQMSAGVLGLRRITELVRDRVLASGLVGVGHRCQSVWLGRSGEVPRDGDCVKCSAPHLGQCRNVSAARPSAEIAPTSLPSSARSTVRPRGATENMEIDRIRRRAADLGTRHA
jgi:hypothetical protein